MTTEMNDTEHCVSYGAVFMVDKVFFTFESVNEILKRDYSNERY